MRGYITNTLKLVKIKIEANDEFYGEDRIAA